MEAEVSHRRVAPGTRLARSYPPPMAPVPAAPAPGAAVDAEHVSRAGRGQFSRADRDTYVQSGDLPQAPSG
jgi:hypothetical protein